MRLHDKIIVLTGPSSGVGLELLKELGPGNRIVGLSRRSPPDEAVRQSRDYRHYQVDMADQTSLDGALSEIRAQEWDRVDGVINCGAIQYTPRFIDDEFDPASIAREVSINFLSPIRLIAGLLDRLERGSDPFIMNINSGLGIVPKHESAVYCATKAGLDNFTRGLRAQLSIKGIKVQQAFLPLVDTPMTEGRGSGKVSARDVALKIIRSIENGRDDTDVGKVKVLRVINRLAPSLAHRLMQGSP